MPDLIERTARQVYLPGGVVHELVGEPRTENGRRRYRTRCELTLTAKAGAILTTQPVGCGSCLDVLPGDTDD